MAAGEALEEAESKLGLGKGESSPPHPNGWRGRSPGDSYLRFSSGLGSIVIWMVMI